MERPRTSQFCALSHVSSLIILGVIMVALIAGGLIYARFGVMGTTGTTQSTSTNLGTIPAPVGYLGASFVSSGTTYLLNTLNSNSNTAGSSPDISKSASSGSFSFAFSSSTYPESALSVSYQSCSRTLTGGTTTSETTTGSASSGTGGSGGLQQSCSQKTSLDFSYNQNSQGQFVATTNSMTLPCGTLQSYDGNMIPTQYLLVSFGVNTIGQPGAEPYFYNYLLYAAC
jgi:hypothetical protein